MARPKKKQRKSNPRDGIICPTCGELSYSKFCLECGSPCTDPEDNSFYDDDDSNASFNDSEISLKNGISSSGLGDFFQDDD